MNELLLAEVPGLRGAEFTAVMVRGRGMVSGLASLRTPGSDDQLKVQPLGHTVRVRDSGRKGRNAPHVAFRLIRA